MWFALVLSIVVVVYNNLINRWTPFHGSAYVPVNLAFAGAITLTTAISLNLGSTQLGLRGDMTDIAIALAVVGVFAAAVFGLAKSRHGHRIADRRIEGLAGGALAFYVLVRIPIGTAVTEEVIFRGTLFAAWRDAGATTFGAALFASIAFGLWHIEPTRIGMLLNDPGASSRKLSLAILGAVLLTTTAGLALTWLRLETEGVLAPVLVHAGINSMAALAAVSARRRRGPTDLAR